MFSYRTSQHHCHHHDDNNKLQISANLRLQDSLKCQMRNQNARNSHDKLWVCCSSTHVDNRRIRKKGDEKGDRNLHLNASRSLYTVCVEWMYTLMTTSQCQSNKAIVEAVCYRILREHFGNKNELRMLSNGILSFTITSHNNHHKILHLTPRSFFGLHSISHTFLRSLWHRQIFAEKTSEIEWEMKLQTHRQQPMRPKFSECFWLFYSIRLNLFHIVYLLGICAQFIFLLFWNKRITSFF